MDKKIVFIKTSRGESEVSGMSGDMKRVLLLIDGNSNFEHVIKRAPPSLRGDLREIIQRLLDAELIADKSKSKVELKIVNPRMIAPQLTDPGEELDFTSMFKAPSAEDLAAEAVRQKEREASRLKAVEAAQLQAATIARQQAEVAAKVEAEAKVKQEAVERQAAEARAKAEAAARLRAEQEAARIKAQLEAVAKSRRDAEEQARRNTEDSRLKAEQEAARVKAELEAAAKAKREAEVRARQEAAAAEKAKAEKVRRKAEEEAARIQAELEAAKARAEAEAKALAEERSRIKAEEEAAARAKAEEERQQREAEAARIKAEEEAATRAKAEEERQQREAEAARIRIKAEEEAATRAKAEEERQQREAEAARIKAEEEAAARAKAEETHIIDKEAAQPQSEFAFKIDLEGLKDVMPAPVMVEQDNQPESKVEMPQTISIEPGQQEIVQPAEPEERKIAQPDIGAEMARLKAEQDAQQFRAAQAAKEEEEAQRLAAEQATAWADAEQRATQQRKLETEQAAIQAALAQAKAQQKAAGRGRHKSVSPMKLLGGLLGLILILIFVLPLFWPMEKYISPIEQRISARLGQPVTVGGLKASLLPLPKIEISRLVVGANRELQVENVALRFDPFSFFFADKVINEVSLQGVTVEGKSLEQVMTRLQGLSGESGFILRRVNVQNLQIRTAGFSLPTLSGNAQFDNGAFARLVLHDENEKMHAELKPVAGRWQIAFGIRENTLPLLPWVTFGDFNAIGEIGAGEAVFSELDAHAYGGIWSGRGRLSWNKEWRAEARINAKTMELDKMFAQYGISGELFADGSVSAKSGSLAGLANTLRVEANFEAKRGVINGIDVVETARLLSRDHLAGGRTHFDQLSGSALLEDHILHLRQLRIESGMLNASGAFNVSEDGQLAGNFNSEIKMREGNNPLVLSGTLKEPKLQAR